MGALVLEEPGSPRFHQFCKCDFRRFVSGSWACWGPADQDTDGDNTLHVLVDLAHDLSETGEYAPLHQMRQELADLVGDESRVRDYIVLSDATWSENQTVVLGPDGDRESALI